MTSASVSSWVPRISQLHLFLDFFFLIFKWKHLYHLCLCFNSFQWKAFFIVWSKCTMHSDTKTKIEFSTKHFMFRAKISPKPWILEKISMMRLVSECLSSNRTDSKLTLLLIYNPFNVPYIMCMAVKCINGSIEFGVIGAMS